MSKSKEPQSAAAIIMRKIKRGATNADALAAAKKVHPRTTIRLASVNWYRNRLREKDPKISSDREARRK